MAYRTSSERTVTFPQLG